MNVLKIEIFLCLYSYAQRDYIMTPFLRPSNQSEAAYNYAHTSTRSCIERSIGVLKQQFRCLDASAGYVMSSPGYMAQIVIACCVLHNMAIRNGIELDLPDDELPIVGVEEHLNVPNQENELDGHRN